MVGIEGAVSASLTANTQATITMPKSGLTVIGVQTSADAHLTIPLDAARNAIIFSDHNLTSPIVVKFNLKLSTTTFLMTSDASVTIYVYYGTPFPGAKDISAYAGVLSTISPTASGSGSFTVTFPGSQRKAVGALLSASASYYDINFASQVGETFYLFGAPNLIQEVVPMDAALPNSLTVNYTAAGALDGYIVIYYS